MPISHLEGPSWPWELVRDEILSAVEWPRHETTCDTISNTHRRQAHTTPAMCLPPGIGPRSRPSGNSVLPDERAAYVFKLTILCGPAEGCVELGPHDESDYQSPGPLTVAGRVSERDALQPDRWSDAPPGTGSSSPRTRRGPMQARPRSPDGTSTADAVGTVRPRTLVGGRDLGHLVKRPQTSLTPESRPLRPTCSSRSLARMAKRRRVLWRL